MMKISVKLIGGICCSLFSTFCPAIADNSPIDAPNKTKHIEMQLLTFCYNGQQCTLYTRPLSLFTYGLFPLPAKVKGSTLGWYVGGKWLSYYELKRIASNAAK
jgi:hypothetical protein